MKKIVLFLCLLLIACGGAVEDVPFPDIKKVTPLQGITYAYGVNRFVDNEAGVVCWIYSGGNQGGISCLPINETLLSQVQP